MLRRMILLSVIYGLLLLLPAFLGVLLSCTAQPGGISQSNAFLAPFLGPWSQTLPPNAHPVRLWSAQYSLFTRSLTLALVISTIGFCLATDGWLRHMATGMTVSALLVWGLAGLIKVVSQLH